MASITQSVFLAILTLACASAACVNSTDECEVRARTKSGWVCGRRLYSDDFPYASFNNVPYAKQPLGELRFQELQPAEPWHDLYDASAPGPACPNMFGSSTVNTSEACIHANVYTPLRALNKRARLPVLVHIYGGAFVGGSSSPRTLGPEYLIKKNMVIFTFNYRINIFGYMFLDSPSIPNNRGLRDAIFFLKWVKANARYFGGNPNDVTLMGHSSGSLSAHLLTLSKAAVGLFKRVILLSGVAIRSFFTPSQQYAKEVTSVFLSGLGINSTDPDEIHRHLIAMPLETLINGTSAIVSKYLFTSFTPVIETRYPNITTVIDEDPEVLVNKGLGKHIPLIIGFTDREEEFVKPYFLQYNVLQIIENNPLMMVPQVLLYSLTEEKALEVARQNYDRYFNGTPTIDEYGKYFADTSFAYPAMKLAQLRASSDSAPVYLYNFRYNASFSAVKVATNTTYNGAAHGDDLFFIFKTNSMNGIEGFEPPTSRDSQMRLQMTTFVKNFMTCTNPTCNKSASSSWPAEDRDWPLEFEKILEPDDIQYTEITEELQSTFHHYENLYSVCSD